MQLNKWQSSLTKCNRQKEVINMQSIEFLVNKAKKGDHEAFIQLISQYELTLYRTAKRMRLQDEDIADLIQDTILNAYEKMNTLNEARHFNTWLCRILLNNCYSFLKKKNKCSPIDATKFHDITHLDKPSLELDDALGSLGENYRLALTLYYVNGLSTKEISECLHESEGTIKSRLSRAKQHLKKNYYSEGEILI